MTVATRAQVATPDPSQAGDEGRRILEAARGLKSLIRGAAEEAERARTLPPAVVAGLRQAGVFRMSYPREWGGPQLSPAEQFEVVEEIAAADGSTGWCAYVGSNGGHFAAYLDPDVARDMFTDLDAPSGGVPSPIGAAELAPGGYVLTGQWPFGSGVRHAEWFLAGALVRQGGQVVLDKSGKPTVIAAFVRTSEMTVLDTWQSTGLRGTGSHDFVIDQMFVPAERTFNFYTTPVRRPEPLYAFPNMFFFNHAAAVLGIARAAIEAFREICLGKKTPWGPLSRQSFALSALSRAEALTGSARCYALRTLEDLHAALSERGSLSLDEAARFRLAITHAHHAAVEAVDLVFNAAGTTAVKAPSVLDRCFRDVHTANQHLVASPMSYSIVGGMLLGETPSDPLYYPPRPQR
ncbi:acyl-CoA dehydrogenase family protein [Alsobacter sp. SYSU M60028]|uniref:Acyl-CoA dehydrogenase family protein n=1 Tax=Alsobacter ponti TaxID=2962936 RepID=A0ABT1LEQ4_9HYPH|nr:acyl-CoA dehydrogenase family protein [Alsobacter ponti]MCP8939990.1 acyl-CoA dehydrogenase family protein [Alsobacter ponti]